MPSISVGGGPSYDGHQDQSGPDDLVPTWTPVREGEPEIVGITVDRPDSGDSDKGVKNADAPRGDEHRTEDQVDQARTDETRAARVEGGETKDATAKGTSGAERTEAKDVDKGVQVKDAARSRKA